MSKPKPAHQRVCTQCGAQFTYVTDRSDNRGRPPLTCSEACKAARLLAQHRDYYAKRLEIQQRRRTRGSPYLGVLACQVDGCERNNYAKGLCSLHYNRLRKDGLFGPPKPKKRPDYTEWVCKKSGYVYKMTPGAKRRRLVHRIVMEQHLGRPLLPHENVHHINGDRADNRIENLELWSKSQPSGQRVTDKVAWAIELLELYAPDVLANRAQLRLVI